VPPGPSPPWYTFRRDPMAVTDTLPVSNPKSLAGGDRPPGLLSDRVFRWVALAAGLTVLVVLALIVASTVNEAWPWFRAEGIDAIVSDDWNPAAHHFGALGLLVGTLEVAVIALVLAVPVSIGIALFVTDVAPRRLRRPIVYTIDLLAAIPSVVFGLWALNVLTHPLADIYRFISDATAGIPILGDVFGDPNGSGQAFMTGGIVVAIMITPIVTAITREVIATCPTAQKEAALALGATRWEMIRGAVFPHARSGIVAAVMIGFGRAVGETIAVALVIGSSQVLTANLFGSGDTAASVIANQFGEASGTHRAALIGLGVVLLGLTIAIGVVARGFLARAERRMGAMA
jgi:phosphate transport system permease protein